MEKILILFALFLTQALFSQTFIETDRFNYPSNIFYGDDGYYFKDTQGYLNQYLGTWQYNRTSLVIQLRFVKKTLIRNTTGSENFKIDALIGGIRIVKNGQEALNTLSSINETKSSDTDYFIYNGPRIQNTANCTLCTVPNQRIYMFYDEPHNDNNHLADMFFPDVCTPDEWWKLISVFGISGRCRYWQPNRLRPGNGKPTHKNKCYITFWLLSL